MGLRSQILLVARLISREKFLKSWKGKMVHTIILLFINSCHTSRYIIVQTIILFVTNSCNTIIMLFMNYCYQAEEAVEVWQRSWSGFLGACIASHYRGILAPGLFVVLVLLWLCSWPCSCPWSCPWSWSWSCSCS